MTTIPESHLDLLERPLIASLGTIREDGHVQVNPMWYLYDGEHLRFTHTSGRQKFKNLSANPAMTIMIVDPEDSYRYLEVRGRLKEVIPDPQIEFYQKLQVRYGVEPYVSADAPRRVVLVLEIEATQHQ